MIDTSHTSAASTSAVTRTLWTDDSSNILNVLQVRLR